MSESPPPSLVKSAVHRLAEDVVTSFRGAPDERLRQILSATVRHLHSLAVEVDLTHTEWERAVNFVTRLGKACTDVRQEVILLSDVLGLSMLLEIMNGDPDDARASEATVLGPFHMTESPVRSLGDSIDLVRTAPPLVVKGQVFDTDGRPLKAAAVDVWQADENGFYDVQVPDQQPPGNGRGLFHTSKNGDFWFTTVAPAHYPIPTDGPVGELLAATGRHPFRPAHIHFIVDSPGHRQLTTHIFLADSPYLDSDAVFAVRESLISSKRTVADRQEAARLGVSAPFELCEVRLVLEPESDPQASEPGD